MADGHKTMNARHIDIPLGRHPMGYADELRRVIHRWRHREWSGLRRKAREPGALDQSDPESEIPIQRDNEPTSLFVLRCVDYIANITSSG